MSNQTTNQTLDLILKADLLLSTENRLSYFIFENIFGDLAEHLWGKWEQSGRQILKFMTRLDKNNKFKLMEWSVKTYLTK